MKLTEQAKNRVINIGLLWDSVYLSSAVFICATMFSVALTSLGWLHMSTVACIMFAVLCPVDIVLLFKAPRFWIWWTVFSMPIGMFCFSLAGLMKLPRGAVDRVYFAGIGYIAASLASKLLYKFRDRTRTHG